MLLVKCPTPRITEQNHISGKISTVKLAEIVNLFLLIKWNFNSITEIFEITSN